MVELADVSWMWVNDMYGGEIIQKGKKVGEHMTARSIGRAELPCETPYMACMFSLG